MKTIAPGERLVYRFEAKAAGIMAVPLRYRPADPAPDPGNVWPVSLTRLTWIRWITEYVMVQGEAYLTTPARPPPTATSWRENSPDLIAAGTPTLTMFNGRDPVQGKALQVKKGERVRIW